MKNGITKLFISFLFISSLYCSVQAGPVTQLETPETEKKIPRLIPITHTTFVNGRLNHIIITLTDSKNQTSQLTIRSGHSLTHHHQAKGLKKAICSEKNDKNVTISESDLNNYEVFVFNTDQKTEKYHFKTMKQKEAALQKARTLNNIKAFHDITDQTVYNP